MFHEMIRADFGELSDLVLPDLVTLTELKVPEMWLPLKRNGVKERAMVGFPGPVADSITRLTQKIGVPLPA